MTVAIWGFGSWGHISPDPTLPEKVLLWSVPQRGSGSRLRDESSPVAREEEERDPHSREGKGIPTSVYLGWEDLWEGDLWTPTRLSGIQFRHRN